MMTIIKIKMKQIHYEAPLLFLSKMAQRPPTQVTWVGSRKVLS